MAGLRLLLRLAGFLALGAVALGLIAAALLFVVTVWWRLGEHRLAAGSGDWVAVPATLLDRQVRASGDHLVERVRYRYTVAGREYESTRGSFPDGDDFGWNGARPVDPLLEATAITCYVSPRDPGSAALERGPTRLGALVWILAALALLFLLGARIAWRWSRALLRRG